MKKLKVSDKGYEILLKTISSLITLSKKHSQEEKDLLELLEDLKNYK